MWPPGQAGDWVQLSGDTLFVAEDRVADAWHEEITRARASVTVVQSEVWRWDTDRLAGALGC